MHFSIMIHPGMPPLPSTSFFSAGIDKSADHTLFGVLSLQRLLQVRCPPIPDHASLLSFMYTHRTIPYDRVPRSCPGHSVELHHSDDLPVNRIQLCGNVRICGRQASVRAFVVTCACIVFTALRLLRPS